MANRSEVVPAPQRFAKTVFDGSSDFETYPRAEYRCPTCQQTVGFGFRDLERHALSEYTNLHPDDARAAGEAAAPRREHANSSLDFYCPGCSAPVRIYYDFGAAGKGVPVAELKFVAQLRSLTRPGARHER